MTTIGQNKCSTSEKIGQIIYVSNSESEIEYWIELKTKKRTKIYTLYSSNSNCWTEHHKNKILFIIEDDGNGLTYKYFDDESNQIKKFKQHRLEYHTALYIQILLDYISSKDLYKEKFTYLTDLINENN